MNLKFKMLLPLLFVLIANISYAAAVTPTLNYQGRLTDSNGVPISDGAKTMDFKIYDAVTGGNLEWDQTGVSVTVTDGLFSTVLGSVADPLSAADWTLDLWLEITVDGTTYSPRQQLTGVAYSMLAMSIADDSVNSAKVVDGSLTAADLSVNVVSSVDGVTNDGGNIDLVAGTGIAITPNDAADTITISASATGLDHGGLSGLGDDDHSQYVLDAGDTMSGTLNMGGNTIDNVADPTAGTHAMDRDYADARYVNDGCTDCLNATEIADIYLLNNANDSTTGSLTAADFICSGGNCIGSAEVAGLVAGDLTVDVVSSVDGVTNDGGNIDLVAGTGITITPNDVANTITIAASATGLDHGGLSGLGDDDHSQYVLDAGDTMSGTLNMGGNTIDNVADPTAGTHAMDRDYADARYVNDGCTDCLNATEIADIYLLNNANDSTTGSLTAADFICSGGNCIGSAEVAGLVAGDLTVDVVSSVDGVTNDGGDIDLVAGTGITITPDDVADTITLAVSAGAIDHGSLSGLGDDDHSQYVLDAGDTMSGTLNMAGNIINNVADPTAGTHAMDRDYADARYVNDGCTDCLNATEIEDIYLVNNANDSTTGSLTAADFICSGGNCIGSAEVAGLVAGDLTVNVVSSVDGVINDGGNIDLIAGTGIAITPNDTANTITLAVSASGVDHDGLNNLEWSVAGHTMDATLDMGAQLITNVADPTAGTHVMDRDYADTRYVNDGCTDCLNATEIEDIYLVNNANDSTSGALTALDFICSAGNCIGSAEVAGLVAGDLTVNVVSSVDGVTNDGGNIDFVAGNGITITPNDTANTITVATNEGDIDHNALNNLAWSVAGHTMNTTLNMGAQLIDNLADPTAGTHAMDRDYADARYVNDGCTDCIDETEIEDIYLFNNADDETSGDLIIGGGKLTISKAGTWSEIIFPAQTNDPAYIKHYENNNTGVMYFSASDDYSTTDYFSFGAAPGGTFNEGARLTTSGNLQLDGTLNVGADADMNSNQISEVGNPADGDDAMPRDYADARYSCYYKTGAALTGVSSDTTCDAGYCIVSAANTLVAGTSYETYAADKYDGTMYSSSPSSRYTAISIMCCPCLN